ncbi:heptaprenylglyceryl phosphate synthase [Bacillus thermotolerans]|uniref:Heptaprenylglyceryl phosphate synthase n=1 Tax=Bacillus thermotolerans TaxID=1221996 RepID=A0A0F5I3L6_BACTR|nr:heptaprenylglyceryl phosphate synthase [Bacillus thermotolerans]KKB35731.1 (S)-3-O-geranylgeranylglyceryl phosphate synthase [Bacillus thermotolerans]KKB40038.1 (S)-3-O-geranylgeranylglyceryl phosphate synthase [Bacillus thermotolerans]KKB43647.1 (S)-3-O-geranylgeranylglyceryl phosphate synthase [Bacillus thermotolerans]
MYDVHEWRHVFKLDPNKDIDDSTLEEVCESGTDAIIIGGSDGVTVDNVLNLMARVRRYTVPCVLEVSTVDSITPGFDSYFIPVVLNSKNTEWVTGLHHEAVKEYGELMDWDEIYTEGYCIANPDCKAASLTEAKAPLSVEDIQAYAMMAEKMFRLPLFYLEYSGTYGDLEAVRSVRETLKETTFIYGGGIQGPEQAKEIAQYADIVVVGNAVYENTKEALKTVKAVKDHV